MRNPTEAEFEEMKARVVENSKRPGFVSAAEALALGVMVVAKQAHNKFNVSAADQRTMDGIVFDSKKEMETYAKLKFLRDAGCITDLRLQPVFLLQDKFRKNGVNHRAVTYKADFSFVEKGKTRVIDVKGFHTPMFRLKRKLFEAKYPDLTIECWR
jgi:hypothetical protein